VSPPAAGYVPVDRRQRAGRHGASARTLFALRPGKWSIASLFEDDAESVVLSPYDATIPDHSCGSRSAPAHGRVCASKERPQREGSRTGWPILKNSVA
jgi:hypothetical protein